MREVQLEHIVGSGIGQMQVLARRRVSSHWGRKVEDHGWHDIHDKLSMLTMYAGIKRIVYNKDYDSELSKEMVNECEDM